MRLADLHYHLPPDRIAQRPLAQRSASRLMLLDRARAGVEDRAFRELPDLLRPGDLLVLNDTRVVAARLLGRRPTGGKVELLLTDPVDDVGPPPPAGEGRLWWTLGRANRPLRPGQTVELETASATVVEVGREGALLVSFSEPALAIAEREGQVPLPPYIKRPPEPADRERYQTIFARDPGAVAAPTAALHFDDATLAAVRERGVALAAITLHVGPGTFQPIKVDDLAQHRMGAERYTVPAATAHAVRQARERGGRVIAVGTTSTRTLETAADGGGGVVAGSGRSELFIVPGHRFRVVDALLTNFHLPGSTLIALVMALAGRERILEAYRLAVERGYRFFSYGDCMLIA
ncbi:MAG: tRNA preQ1(34) S-adenosylmethionine ribosyltransferase-isomerase QueA [Deltaproteobacteria bacterium]|nr:tRNA preQ1(34) S-adenosylmethionine ribosyltransferase-isomerase QueA [Deltaproteobacteria bacterium]